MNYKFGIGDSVFLHRDPAPKSTFLVKEYAKPCRTSPGVPRYVCQEVLENGRGLHYNFSEKSLISSNPSRIDPNYFEEEP